MTPGNIKGALLALLSMGLYSTHDVIIKLLGETYPALQVLFFSALLSFPPIALLLLRDPTPATLRPRNPFWVGLRSACIVISGVCGFYAFSTLPLAQVYSILFAAPMIVTILSVPLVVLRPGATQIGLGHLAALVGATAGAVSAIAVRKLGRSERTVILILWPMIGNFIVTGASLGFAYRPMELGDLALTGVIAILGLVAGVLLILAYQAGEATNVAPMQYSQILWAVGYGWFLFDEHPDGATVLGAGLIVASGLYILMRERLGTSRTRPVTGARLSAEAVTSPRWSLLQRLLRDRG